MNYQLLPYERTSDLPKTLLGYQPGGETLQSILEHANEVLEPIEQRIKDTIRDSPIGHGNKTSIRVDGQTQWLRVLSSLSYTYYYWSKHRVLE